MFTPEVLFALLIAVACVLIAVACVAHVAHNRGFENGRERAYIQARLYTQHEFFGELEKLSDALDDVSDALTREINDLRDDLLQAH